MVLTFPLMQASHLQISVKMPEANFRLKLFLRPILEKISLTRRRLQAVVKGHV